MNRDRSSQIDALFRRSLGVGSAHAALISGIVAHYQFDGDATDASGSGNDATVSGALLTSDRFGNPNSAYSFDGVDDFIEKANPINLNMGSQSWSIAAWVNSSVSDVGQSIVDRYEWSYN